MRDLRMLSRCMTGVAVVMLGWGAGVGRAQESQPAAGSRPWLGVNVAPVPAPIAAREDLSGRGVIVQDIAIGGPAEAAGVEVSDILLSMNGEPIHGNAVEAFVRAVRDHSVGESVALELLRDGVRREVKVELGAAPPITDVEWKRSQERDIRGKILRPLPGGGYRLEDLGPLWRTPGVGEESEDVTYHGRWTRGGETIDVEGKRGGPITVRRSKEGHEDSVEYEDADALAKGDPEAHKLFDRMTARRRVPLRYRAVPPEELEDRVKEWYESFRDQMKTFDEWMKKHPNAVVPWYYHQPYRAPRPGAPWPWWSERVPDRERAPAAPRRSFTVGPGGGISAVVREGESELRMEFKDAADMKARAPKLYAEYEKLHDSVK
jgi:hypothetical protein